MWPAIYVDEHQRASRDNKMHRTTNLETNKSTVVAFYDLIFNKGQPADAVGATSARPTKSPYE